MVAAMARSTGRTRRYVVMVLAAFALSAAACGGDDAEVSADGSTADQVDAVDADGETGGQSGDATDGSGGTLDVTTDDAEPGSGNDVSTDPPGDSATAGDDGEGDNPDDDSSGDDNTVLGGGTAGGTEPVIADDDPVAEILPETGDGLEGEELEQYLAQRFKAYWIAFDRARAAPAAEPERAFPQLQVLAEGAQLVESHLELEDLHETGQAYRMADPRAVEADGEDDLIRVRVDSIDGGVAELTVCLVNDRVRYQQSDGAIISASVISVRSRATMARNEGTWKLIDSRALDIQPGVSGCWTDEADQFPW
jgi:hypothetical protein